MKIVIRRSELVAAGACAEGLDFFKTLAPKGVLKIEWSPLTQCWLAVEARQWISWAIAHNVIPIANLTGADLENADLGGADLADANLTYADLGGANLTRADLGGANLTRADLADTKLTYANLTRANLTSADLENAIYPSDLPGWKSIAGILHRV